MKTTLIPLITIPVSLIATFAVINVLGFDINILTLVAMFLAFGLVVDDAIIVVERVQYLMVYEKMDAHDASVKAMQQIASAIIATTFVLLSIFIPVGLMAGITGKIYQQFAVTIATAVVFSAYNALTLSPSLCAIFLRGDKQETPHGYYKRIENEVGGMPTTKPENVCKELKALLKSYNNIKQKSLKEIIEFHYEFEKIHPFQDGNGRVGRLIMFKECLKYNIVPFIIEDNLKMFYYRGLKEWNNEKGYLTDTCLTAQVKY